MSLNVGAPQSRYFVVIFYNCLMPSKYELCIEKKSREYVTGFHVLQSIDEMCESCQGILHNEHVVYHTLKYKQIVFWVEKHVNNDKDLEQGDQNEAY